MTATMAAPTVPTSSAVKRLHPLPLTGYSITGGFWWRAQRLNRDAIIPHCDNSLEEVGWVNNFRAAARGTLATDRVGRLFTDSEIYKTGEAMLWEHARSAAPEFQSRVGEYAALLSAAQAPDGYLNTFYGWEGGPPRYSDMEWGHELYCAGHLIQAGVAALRTGGPRSLIDVALRAADHICNEFHASGRQLICGHPEIETALVELYRATGTERYLEQARLFVERRGHRTLGDTMFRGRDYYQDNVPVRDARVLVGHAVRALYLAAGAIDVAVETGDTDLLEAVRTQYDATLERRTYLTGGMGSNHHGETFGEDYELPSERAYAETCAAVASIQVAWKLLLATGAPRYADVIERTLYNNVMSSPSADGRSFFYVNALQRRSPGLEPEPGVPSLRRTDGMRARWFTTSCCPTNVARLLASLGSYMATTHGDGVQLHQYAAGVLNLEIGGNEVRLSVDTMYPDAGTVTIRIDRTSGNEWTLALRVPDWAGAAAVDAGGETRIAGPGVVELRRAWRPGDEIRLQLNTEPRFTFPDPRIDHLRGSLAVECGPLVYAMESVDQPGIDLDQVLVDPLDPPRVEGTAQGLPDATAVTVRGQHETLTAEGWPYHAEPTVTARAVKNWTLVPYYRWANRGSSTMRVWIPRADLPL